MLDAAHIAYLNNRQARLAIDAGDLARAEHYVRQTIGAVNRSGHRHVLKHAFRLLNNIRRELRGLAH